MNLIAWLKEWQPLVGGGLVVLAACIFAAGSVMAARIRATAQTRSADNCPDLRTASSTSGDSLNSPSGQPVDLVQTLQQLRSLVRSALSALTPSEQSAVMPVVASHQCYERILRLPLEASDLPANSSKTAQDLLALLAQNIEALSLLHKKNAPASEMSNMLIKVNTAARNLLVVLGSTATSGNPNPPSTLRQQ